MSITLILSILVSVFSLGLVLIGLPAQIAKNYREKRSGQPILTIVIALGFYVSQIAFFFVTGAYLPLISFVVGVIMWGIVLIQYLIYENS